MTAVTLSTERLRLRPFRAADRDPFADMNAHPLVVESLGSNPSHAESDRLMERLMAEWDAEGWGMWAAELTGGPSLVGMIGLHRVNPAVPFAPAVEIAWRLHPDHWGYGYATEGALATLIFGFETAGLSEIVSMTTKLNRRSQSVMERIGMVRDREGDFDHPSVAEDSPLRRHVLYRIRPGGAGVA